MAQEPTELTSDELQSIVSTAVKSCVDFIDSDIAPSRIQAQRYMDGETDLGVEEGRSNIVSTKVRDTVRAIKPSLQKVFMTTDKAVEFIPRGPEDVAAAAQATSYCNYIFNKNNGFRLLSDVFHDAMVKRVGILKSYYEDTDHQTIHEYTGLDQAAFDFLEGQPDLTVMSQDVETTTTLDPASGMDVETPIISCRVARKKRTGQIKIDSVPPEEFYINREARSLEDAYCVVHRTEMRVGDLVALGYDFDEVADLSALDDTNNESEKTARHGYSVTAGTDDNEGNQDVSMRLVAVSEAYMRVDTFGTGIPSLYRFVLGGGSYTLLSAEPIDKIPFSIFEISPEPHSFFGTSIVDLIRDDQDAATSIMRGILDNVAMTNTPRLVVQENAVNIDDILNNEIGAVIRARSPGAVQDLTIPFAAGQTLPALQYMDQMIEAKTGITRASQGLNPEQLQSTSSMAISAQMQAAAGQTEVMARNLAEGGMTQLFKLILHLSIQHQDKETVMRINGNFVPVDPSSWQADMDMTTNVGLGTGRAEERQAALQQAMQIQQGILQQYGPQNGLVMMHQFRNTAADLLSAAGIKDADRYFMPLTMESEQQMMAQQAQQAQQQAQQGQPDPNQAFLQVEQMKAQQRGQSDMMKLQLDSQKAQANHQLRQQEMAMSDDRGRDQMVQDLAVKVAEILGKYGTSVDVERVRAEQAAPRDQGMM